MARRVIAADLQEGMLQKLREKIRGTELENRITLHKTEENKIGLLERIDFALAFYVVHEIPDQRKLFKELESILRRFGKVLFVEPSFRVSKSAFAESIEKARNDGFDIYNYRSNKEKERNGNRITETRIFFAYRDYQKDY